MVIDLKRKGDVTITTVILIVLGLAVLVMLILGFSKGWDFIFKPFDTTKVSDLQTFAKACGAYVTSGLSIDFCNFRLVGDEIVNCRDDRVLASLKTDGVNPIACSYVNTNLGAICGTLSGSKKDNIKVNGQVGLCNNIPEGNVLKNRIEKVCTGTPKACTEYMNQNECTAVGCSFDGSACTGTSKACDKYNSLNECTAVGCEWKFPSA